MKFPSLLSAKIFLVMTALVVACNIYTLIPLYSTIAEDLLTDSKQVAIASTIFTFCYATGLLIFGPLSDWMGRKKMILTGLAFSSLSTIAVGWADSLLSLYIWRGIQGVTLATFAPVAFTYSYELFLSRQRTFLIALINSAFLVAGAAGQLTSLLISSFGGWQMVFFLFSFVYFLLYILGTLFLPPTVKKPGSPEPLFYSFMRIIQKKKLLLCYIIVFTLLFSFVAYFEMLERFYTHSEDELLLIRATALIGACLSLFTNKFVERFGELNTLLIGMVIVFFSLAPLFFWMNVTIYTLSSMCFVSGLSLLLPSVITWIGRTSADIRAKAMSLYSFILLLGAGTAPLLFHQLSYFQGLAGLSLLFSLDLVILVYMIKKDKKREA